MPYLNEGARAALRERGYPVGPGELNFVLAQVCIEYLNNNAETYQTHNDIIGALEAQKLEWYRRIVAPYEDGKVAQNGDVYH